MKNSDKPTCGDAGGTSKNTGEPCEKPAGWGTDFDTGKCKFHRGTSPDGESHKGNQNAMKTGVNSDPVNLFNWLSENEPDGLAYILNKLWDYSKQSPQPVFEVDVSKQGIDSFEDAEMALTSYGDDVLLMCIRDYVRWRGAKQQIQENLTTEQWRSGDGGKFKVTDANPVNLELDRVDRTAMKYKDKLGLLPSPEKQQAEAMEKTLAEVLHES